MMVKSFEQAEYLAGFRHAAEVLRGNAGAVEGWVYLANVHRDYDHAVLGVGTPWGRGRADGFMAGFGL